MDMELAARMLDQVAAVPAGSVATYGDIAARAGSPSPRLAGRVLAEMSDETTPWHRILRADGTPAAHLRDQQCALLTAEGVEVVHGRVDLKRYRWRSDQDRPDRRKLSTGPNP
jgi:methylated-DNA-protein-cysteine methyltransferase-like protein